MFKGIGKIFLRTTQLGDLSKPVQRAAVLAGISWADNVESTQKESQRFIEGELKTVRTVKGSSTYSLEISFNELDWMHMGFAKNEFPKTGSNVALPSILSANVPSASPYEISNAFFTAANDTTYGIYAVVTADGAWGPSGGLIRGATTPASGEVVLDAANTKLVFHEDQAGAPVDIPIFATKSSIEFYGGPGVATKFGVFELWGQIFVPSIAAGIWRRYPQVEIVSEPSVTIDNNVPTVTVQCSAGIPTGWEKPYAEYNLNTAVV
jgi:hypothetical protein